MSYDMQMQPPMALQTPEEKQMGMFMHLSLASTFFLPWAGLLAPIIFWQIKKDELPALDAHGKMITNWVISSVIYSVICGFLIGIGIPLTLLVVGIIPIILGGLGLFAVWVMGIVFSIIGGLKANEGEFWEYPLTIKFLK